jgi:hypothetical protein
MTALFDAVERDDLELARLLLERGATTDEDAFYHACEQSDTAFLDLLHAPGFERLVNHKLDFEDAAGLRWFLERGVDVDAHRCLHHAICRGRGLTIVGTLLDAGADVNLPWDRWDVGRRPLALAARCGHLAAYELLAARGATAELDAVDEDVLAVVRGESVRLPKAPPPSLGNPATDDYGWILGQLALLGRTGVVTALLDDGMAVDTRGCSNLTPLDQAAMHGRTETVRLLIERGADLDDRAFDADGPTPLDCALWGVRSNRADDGDYPGTVGALLAAGAPTRREGTTGDEEVRRGAGPVRGLAIGGRATRPCGAMDERSAGRASRPCGAMDYRSAVAQHAPVGRWTSARRPRAGSRARRAPSRRKRRARAAHAAGA